jgi:cytoskeletal protein CcmA (bactofilin family)
MAILGRNKKADDDMAKDTSAGQAARDNVISIIGPGMKVVGDCETDGTLRIEGVVEGTVRAGKAVVIGKDGSVQGDVVTQDAIIGGRVSGSILAESRLELQATCIIDGEIRARRIKLDEGGTVNGQITTGDVKAPPQAPRLTTDGPVADQRGDAAGTRGESPAESPFHVQQP